MGTLGIGSRVKHPTFGDGVVIGMKAERYIITFVQEGTKEISKSFQGLEVVEAIHDFVSLADVEKLLREILESWAGQIETVELGSRWSGGRMVIYPADETQKAKEITNETLFHKIVMIRDNLRVLEQKINSNKVLIDEDKVELQQYITRIYGTLTTFNFLFREESHKFVGAVKEKA